MGLGLSLARSAWRKSSMLTQPKLSLPATVTRKGSTFTILSARKHMQLLYRK